MPRLFRLTALCALLAASTLAQATPAVPPRIVNLTMGDDMRFTPATVDVRRGETIRFVVHNEGQMTHEFVLGSAAELKEHAEMMRKMPGMAHTGPNIASVAPGLSGIVTWRFSRAGTLDFGCLQPGHYEAGMKGTVRVR